MPHLLLNSIKSSHSWVWIKQHQRHATNQGISLHVCVSFIHSFIQPFISSSFSSSSKYWICCCPKKVFSLGITHLIIKLCYRWLYVLLVAFLTLCLCNYFFIPFSVPLSQINNGDIGVVLTQESSPLKADWPKKGNHTLPKQRFFSSHH